MTRASKQGQQDLAFKTWGGKRKGAGRPPKGRRSSEPHKRRERFTRPTPVHVTLRIAEGLGKLRRRAIYQAIGRAVVAVLGMPDFRIVHLSLENDHLHLIVEAASDGALARGIKAFGSSAAQRINQVISQERGLRRRGNVFADRYHARLIGSPTQARHALAYVLNNWRRHRLDASPVTRSWEVDYFSTGPSFPGWRELDDAAFLYRVPATYERLMVARPQTWLLSTGWQKAGSISMSEVPGPR
ncbi:MAG: transposase [Deltaproteobacteria bacterium]|nr:transposase [Deltaproteobacteria bacterium]